MKPNMIRKVLNEQKDKEFDEDEIDILHFIFERELKPPLSRGEISKYGNCPYRNRDGQEIGWLDSQRKEFVVEYNPFWRNIKDKVCQLFGFSRYTLDWWYAINPHLKSWLEDKLNIKLYDIFF